MVKISITNDKEVVTLTIDGEVDASSSIELDTALGSAIEQSISSVLIDGNDLNYISSAGLGVFMSYLEEIKKRNIKLVIYGLADKVKNVFSILGLDQLLEIVKTREEAQNIIDEK